MTSLFRIRRFTPYLCIAFLNAFVDLGHKTIIQNTVFKVYQGDLQVILTALVNALILLPFIMMFSPSGYCSDKYPKHRVMQASAWIAVILTSLITLFYYLGWFWAAFAMTFMLALQSTFYSPAKYGYIKELVGSHHLSNANGLVQAVTTAAILAGIFIFSIAFEYFVADEVISDTTSILNNIWPVGWLLVAFSLIELLLCYRLPKKSVANTKMRFDWSRYISGRYLQTNLASVTKNEAIFLPIIGLSIFWAVAQVVLALFPAHAKETMDITNSVLIQGMLAFSGFGIVAGSILAGKISRSYIEIGLIPISSIAISLCVFFLPTLDNVVLLATIFFIWGIFGGLFIVPLNALIQFHAKKKESGRVLAGSNFLQSIIMLAFLTVTMLLASSGISGYQQFILLGIIATIGALYTMYRLPQSLLRFVLSTMIGVKYSLRVQGLDNLPENGGVLLLGNHISWLDWAIVQMASPRSVRFVMIRGLYEKWYLRWLFSLFQVIPISSGGSRAALKSINESLKNGDVVCLFPEGSINRTGQLSVFQKGFEKAAEDSDALIVPFYIRGLWGSRFSRSSGKLQSMRSALRRDIVFAFGKPLATDAPAEQVKQAVHELSIHTWENYTTNLESLAQAFVATARHNRHKMMITDSLSGSLSGKRLLTAVIGFSKLINKYSSEQNVGLLLPTSNAGAIANMAALMAGKTIVNLNFTASKEAIEAAVRKANIRTVYCSTRFLEKLNNRGIDIAAILPNTQLLYMEDLRKELSKASLLMTMLQASLLPTWLLTLIHCKSVATESPAAILYSSGSEGDPKGVMLSHKNIMANIKQITDVLNTEDDDVVMATLPLFHAFGLTVTTLMPLIEGMPCVCHPDPTDVVNIAKAIGQHKATVFCATATFLRLYVKNQRVHPLMLESLRVVVSGAEKLNPDVRSSFKAKFNKNIYEGFGATETAPVASVNIPDIIDTSHWNVQIGSKEGTVGLPLPGTSFRIVDPDNLEQLPVGEDGLILIGGCQVMIGYLNDAKKTQQAIVKINSKRWYKTGDKGHIDKDGFLTIIDRYSRFAKLGGEMISLTAVEEEIRAALQNPELELVAVNLPDDTKGEKIILVIAEDYDLTEVKKAMIQAKALPLMTPSAVFVVDEIPKLGSGKTDCNAVKALLIEQSLNTSSAT